MNEEDSQVLRNWNVARVSCGEMWIRWFSLRSANDVKSFLSERWLRLFLDRLSAVNNTMIQHVQYNILNKTILDIENKHIPLWENKTKFMWRLLPFNDKLKTILYVRNMKPTPYYQQHSAENTLLFWFYCLRNCWITCWAEIGK